MCSFYIACFYCSFLEHLSYEDQSQLCWFNGSGGIQDVLLHWQVLLIALPRCGMLKKVSSSTHFTVTVDLWLVVILHPTVSSYSSSWSQWLSFSVALFLNLLCVWGRPYYLYWFYWCNSEDMGCNKKRGNSCCKRYAILLKYLIVVEMLFQQTWLHLAPFVLIFSFSFFV